MAVSARGAGLQIPLFASFPGCLAYCQRSRVSDREPDARNVATIFREGLVYFATRHLRRDRAHAVARDQGRQATRTGRCILGSGLKRAASSIEHSNNLSMSVMGILRQRGENTIKSVPRSGSPF